MKRGMHQPGTTPRVKHEGNIIKAHWARNGAGENQFKQPPKTKRIATKNQTGVRTNTITTNKLLLITNNYY
jgi:hypothetical protein